MKYWICLNEKNVIYFKSFHLFALALIWHDICCVVDQMVVCGTLV